VLIAGRQAYLLAAGRGKRAGGPKAWLLHEGRTLLETQLAFLADLLDPASIAVSIQGDWLEKCRRLDARVHWVPVDASLSPLSSLLSLIKELPLKAWSFLYHVDMPVWEEGLFRALSERSPAAKAAGTEAIIPVEGGKGGHPVLLSPTLASPLAGLDPSKDRLDHWLVSRKAERFDVPYPCIHENWNYREPSPRSACLPRRER